MGGNNKNKKNNEESVEPKWRARYIKEMEKLRGEIRAKEEKGVNVNRAWRLFGIARKLDRKEDVEKAFDYMEKVRGDLAWKERLFDYSTRTVTLWVAYGVPIIIAVPLIGYIVAKCGFGFDLFADKPVMLGMPMFILAWGYIGSTAYILLSVHSKISKRLFDIRDPVGYVYRAVLGGILAGVIFYIIQTGLVSLPGTAGEEVNAALLRTSVVSKYRKLEKAEKEYARRINDRKVIIEDFTRGSLRTQVGKNPGTTDTVEATTREQLRSNETGGEAEPEAGEKRESLEGLNELRRDTREKAEVLITYAAEWENMGLKYGVISDGNYTAKPGFFRSVVKDYNSGGDESMDDGHNVETGLANGAKEDDGINIDDKYKGDITVDRISVAVAEGNYEYVDGCYTLIRGKINGRLKYDNNEDDIKIEKIRAEMVDLRPIIESEVLTLKIEKLEREKRDLEMYKNEYERALNAITTETSVIEGEGVGEPGALDGRIEKVTVEIGEKIGEKEERIKKLREQRETAEKSEEEKPVWESAVFIVIAFFSGYSINFVTKLFDRAMTGIISGKPGETELEGEAPPEPEAGGEETVG